MKMIKKIAPLLLAVCLIVPCFATLVHAADGQIQFTDPSTKTGETVEVTCAVKANGTIEDVELTLTYDTSMLRFKEADGVTEETAGTLTYKGTANANVLRFNMKFDVLKEGTTKIEVASYRAWLNTDEALDCTQGYATIKIAQGETPVADPEEPTATTGTSVDVNGVTYTFSDGFADTDIPAGYAVTTIEYDGAQHKVVKHEVSGLYLGYLVDANSMGKFFVYVEENATFAPFEQIAISDTTTITLLTNVDEVTLPEQYVSTTVTLNGQDFPAWQNAEDSTLCLLYAMNSKGETGVYQFDTVEGTYQRFEVPEVEQGGSEESALGRLSSVLENHLDMVILVGGVGFIVLVILIIVLSVKLYNRNAELDEIYEEYGIDDEDDDEENDTDEEDETKEGVAVIDDADEFEEDFTIDINDGIEEDVILFDDEDRNVVSEKHFEDSEELFDLETKAESFADEIAIAEEPVFEETEKYDESDDFLDDDDFALDFEMDFIDLDD